MPQSDQAAFTSHSNGKLDGVLCTHVDDFYWAGSREFQEVIIDKSRACDKSRR